MIYTYVYLLSCLYSTVCIALSLRSMVYAVRFFGPHEC